MVCTSFAGVEVANNWPAFPVVIGAVLAIPALVYGFYISINHWKDFTQYSEGKSLLISAIVLSCIRIGPLNLGFIAMLWHYIARVHGDIKRFVQKEVDDVDTSSLSKSPRRHR